jgi:hypothetical protein
MVVCTHADILDRPGARPSAADRAMLRGGRGFSGFRSGRPKQGQTRKGSHARTNTRHEPKRAATLAARTVNNSE